MLLNISTNVPSGLECKNAFWVNKVIVVHRATVGKQVQLAKLTVGFQSLSVPFILTEAHLRDGVQTVWLIHCGMRTASHTKAAHAGLCLQWKPHRHGISFHIQLRPKELGEKSVEISCEHTQHSHSNICANIAHTAAVKKRTPHRPRRDAHNRHPPPTGRRTCASLLQRTDRNLL